MRQSRRPGPNAEPLLEDVLADPIVHSVMRRDRVGLDDLRTLIAVVRRHLRTAARNRAGEEPD